ncbi:Mediator of RNA polymerase II transcription subunit 7 [Pseudocercospora fuligena]|uniref:Mediator of RNA polymerase II transcription subunit 7 n=1 Tax=Pseudocercospora fuligena TaxID=685502 RepID=A0A8H6RND1_9PEZI|nr:Mediator of RNA polymerase II transcription subunit 7 [Pseudocercospora fuligena]
MAESKPMAALFPSPPPFYQHFTKQNLSRLRQLRKEAGVLDTTSDTSSQDKKDIDVLALPPELRYLVPPSPPSASKFNVFGAEVDLEASGPSLNTFDIEQLYPDTESAKLNPQSQLLAMSRSLLTTFLSLTGVLANDPEAQEPQLKHLQTLMYNMHDLINQYRPHQARESLIMMMEERVERVKAEVTRIDESKAKVEKLLQGLTDGELGYGVDSMTSSESKQNPEEARRKSRQRAAWKALEAEMG